jgi:hypothetical protein
MTQPFLYVVVIGYFSTTKDAKVHEGKHRIATLLCITP